MIRQVLGITPSSITTKFTADKMLKVELTVEQRLCIRQYRFFCLISVIKLDEIHCSNDQLHVTVTLNDIDRRTVFLGDGYCHPTWSNETHVKFSTHIDACSVVWRKTRHDFRARVRFSAEKRL